MYKVGWVRVELMAWWLSQLECLIGMQWLWVQILLRLTFYGYFKESFSGEYHMCQFILLHSCDDLKTISVKINVVTEESSRPNEIWHWTNNEIGVAVQSWLWVRVEPMASKLSRLEHLNRIGWLWVQVPPRLWLLHRILQWWIPQCALLVITTMALWELMHLGKWSLIYDL